MKVLHLLNTGKFSGAENVVCQICAMLKNDVDFVYCSLEGEIRDVLKEKNIVFAPIKKMSVRELKRVFKDVKPDVIHAHDMYASLFASLACGKIPLVSHIHNNAYDSRSFNIKSIAYYIAARKAKHIFWVSKTAFSGYYFHAFLEKKSSILLNVIDTSALKKKMSEDSTEYSYDVIYVGRLTYQKNPERLIEIFRKLHEKVPNFRACIVGDGDLRDKVKKMIQEYNLNDCVDLLGFRKNPLKILHDSKVMLLVSRWEGLPMSVLESLALGTPIVSTSTDGIDSVVESGLNGFIVDDDNLIVETLKNLITNDTVRNSMSEKSIEMSLLYNDLMRYKKELLEAYF